MEISLRLDTLGMVEVRYLRGRERYRDWPQFELLAASRQARVLAYFTHEVADEGLICFINPIKLFWI